MTTVHMNEEYLLRSGDDIDPERVFNEVALGAGTAAEEEEAAAGGGWVNFMRNKSDSLKQWLKAHPKRAAAILLAAGVAAYGAYRLHSRHTNSRAPKTAGERWLITQHIDYETLGGQQRTPSANTVNSTRSRGGYGGYTLRGDDCPSGYKDQQRTPSLNTVNSTMSRAGYGGYTLCGYDSEEEFDLRQQRYAFPWEHTRCRTDGLEPEKNAFAGNPDGFRKAVRHRLHQQDVDGWTREEKYGVSRADVGHIFSNKNGGSNTLGNAYMQESSFNATIQENQDELNAAFVGYDRTAKAMAESIKYGELREGKWNNWHPDAVVDSGKAKFAQVGVLTKKNGGVDKRCRAVQRGEVTVDKYGMPLGLDKKAKQIRKLGI